MLKEKAMKYLLAGLAAIGFAPLAALAQSEAAAELGEAGTKSAAWTSCKFSITEAVEGGRKGSDPEEGAYDKAKGLHLKSGTSESVTVEGKRASKRRDGTWRARARLEPIESPSSFLTDLEKNFKTVTRSDEGGAKVYSGQLTAAGTAFLLSGLESRLRGQGESKVTARVTVDADGNVSKIEIEGTFAGKIQGQDATVKLSRVISFSDVNKASLQIPEEAQKALDQLP